MSVKVGFLDKDFAYQNALMEYLNYHFASSIQVVVFSDPEKLEQYLATNVLNLLLVGDEFSNYDWNCPKMILTKSREQADELQYFFRYQSSKNLLDYVLQYVGYSEKQDISNCMIFAVYSPLGRCGKTTYAKWLCTQYERSLYVNWEGFTDFDGSRETGSHFLYCLKSRNESCFTFLEEERCTEIGAPAGIFDIRQVEACDLKWFFDGVRARKLFDCIVFDIGAASVADFSVLREFDRVLVPTLADMVSKKKLSDFERMLKQDADTGMEFVQYVELT